MAIILLVDNDPLQAFQRKSILERQFQEVERVGDAADALCLVEQPYFAGKLGLVISGLSMPGIGGPEFVAELHARLPDVPVLVLGSASEAVGDYAGGWVHFLAKPFAMDEMLAAATCGAADTRSSLPQGYSFPMSQYRDMGHPAEVLHFHTRRCRTRMLSPSQQDTVPFSTDGVRQITS